MPGRTGPLQHGATTWRAASAHASVCRPTPAHGRSCAAGLQSSSSRVPRFRLQVALATSLAAACIHYNHKPAPVESHAYVHQRGAVAATSCRRGGLGVRRYATHASTSDHSVTASPSEQIKPGSGEQQQQEPQRSSAKSSNADRIDDVASGTSSSSREAADLSNTNDINELMQHPALMKNIKTPRNPIILCHGLYGFDVRGPFLGLEIHYWATVLDILRKKIGAEVIVRGVPGTGAIADRAEALHRYLSSPEAGIKGKRVNFIGHSMGGLDARYLISVIKPAPEEYKPASLMTLSTPHRGSPFMDWCNANVGTGNDRVEQEIREARERMEKKQPVHMSATAGSGEHEGIVSDEFHKDEVKKLPFSLKTPLFVRPTPSSKEGTKVSSREESDRPETDSIKDELKAAATSVAGGIVQVATSPSSSSKGYQTSEKDEATGAVQDRNGKKKKSDSLLDFKLFNRALSSLTGSFSSYMLSVLDQPAYAMLSTRYMAQVFNPTVPNAPDVAYYSIAARKRSLPIYHPLWLPKLVLDSAAEGRTDGGERDGSADALGSRSQGNDGLVSVESAKWGKFLGVMEGCDHWDLRGGGAPRWSGKLNPQTGKPYPTKDESNEEKKPDEKKSKEGGWSEINGLVRRLFSARNGQKEGAKEAKTSSDSSEEKKPNEAEEKKTGEKVTQEKKSDESPKEVLKGVINAAVPAAFESKKDDDGFIDEVATWISDRLPKGDKDRRMQAEQAADEQDKERRRTADMKEKDSVKADEHETKEKDDSGSTRSSTTASPVSNASTSSPSEAQIDSIETTINKLRREAAWQEELGHNDNARDLRRELAWHRAEWNRVMSSGGAFSPARLNSSSKSDEHGRDWEAADAKRREDGSAKSQDPSGERKGKAGKDTGITSADELERFWVAVCRHLWANGY